MLSPDITRSLAADTFTESGPSNALSDKRSVIAVVSGSSSGLEDIMSRQDVMYLVTMFFEFVSLVNLVNRSNQVYPLQPIVHQESFISNIHARLDTHEPMFLSLLASVLAVTLIHVSLTSRMYTTECC